MFKFLRYKQNYEKARQEKIDLYNQLIEAEKDYKFSLEAFKKKIKDLELHIIKIQKDNAEKAEKIQQLEIDKETLKVLIDKSIAETEEREKLRHKNACRVGGLTKQNHILVKQKQEMVKLIDNLLIERRKYIKDKHHPTLKELKEYFKIKY